MQFDEVRYFENRKPIGFDFLKLRLRDVLLDPKTVQIYTPNMNALARLGDNSLTQDDVRAIMDYRGKRTGSRALTDILWGVFPKAAGDRAALKTP